MRKALLVIDMQNVCVGEKHSSYFKYNNRELIQHVNKVIDANKENMIVYIKHEMKRNLLNKFAPFHAYENTPESELVEGLHVVSDYVCVKYKSNAFSNPELNHLLKSNNVKFVEIIGVDGGACVALTAFGAINHGYKVIINENAIGTMFHRKKDNYFKKLRTMGAEIIKQNFHFESD